MTMLGADRADITPPGPVPLAGYASRAELGPATEVLAPLQLRTLVLGEEGEEPVVIIGADLLWWGTELVRTLRQDVQAAFGIPGEHLVLHATHTHSGPQTALHMTPSLGEVDEGYLESLRRTVLRSIEAALGRREQVSLEFSRAPAEVSVNRRWARTAGRLPRTPIDQELTAVSFRNVRGDRVAMMVHFACHPVVHHGNAITSDFPGAVCAQLERDTAPLVMYLQGCCGDVNPDRYDPDGRYHNGAQDEIEAMGQDLVQVVRRALASPQHHGIANVALRRARVELPLQQRASLEHLHAWATEPGCRGEWSRLMLDHPDRFKRDPYLDLVRVDLAPNLQLLGMPAEPLSSYGLHTKAVSNNTCLPLGYTDGMTTYLVGEQHQREGGYEPEEAPLYMGLPALLAPTTEQVVLDAITDLLTAQPGQRQAQHKTVIKP